MSADISQPNTSPFTYSFAFILSMFTRQIEGEDGAAGGCSGDNLHGGLNEWGWVRHHEGGCKRLILTGKSLELSE